jgi:AcrR family transcriptional regulator
MVDFGSPPTNTRERLIQTAMDLFYHRGFHAVGLDCILNEVGVTKTTFYNHFESKDDLITEVISRRDDWELETWNRAVEARAGDCPRAQLLAMFDVLHQWFNAPEFQGCIFINAAAEFPSPHDPAHQAAARHKQRVLEKILHRAAAAGLADPQRFARQYVMILEGAIVVRQVIGDDGAARSAREVVEMLIARHSAAGSAAATEGKSPGLPAQREADAASDRPQPDGHLEPSAASVGRRRANG